MTIAKFAQVTRIQPCVQNLHEWYVQNLHKSLRESAARHSKNGEVWYNTARMSKGKQI